MKKNIFDISAMLPEQDRNVCLIVKVVRTEIICRCYCPPDSGALTTITICWLCTDYPRFNNIWLIKY
ncbi:hypothetical protein EPF92_19125 [Salmonella enterica]|nr:hypothetical protein [Salmonella enterica]